MISIANGNEILLARKEPGFDKTSGDMFIKEDKEINIPNIIISNCNYTDVKHRLNNLAQLPYIDLSRNDDFGYQTRPSFRDMVSFVFQPQYIVANQSTLFYKADLMIHREKLRAIFPYILNVVDNEYLELKEEYKDKERELNALNKELEKRKKVAEKWLGEIRANYIKAKEFGLINSAPYPNDDWKPEEYISYLRSVSENISINEIPSIQIGATSKTTDIIIGLQQQEIDVAFKLQALRNRQELIKKLEASNKGFRGTLLDQHGRLTGVEWFDKSIQKNSKCPLCEAENSTAKQYVNRLIEVKRAVVEKGFKINDHYTVLSDELNKIAKEIQSNEKIINNIREELRRLLSTTDQNEKRLQTLNSLYKFIGQLEAELKNYDAQLDNSDLLSKIVSLEENRLLYISDIIDQVSIDNKIRVAIRRISDSIKDYAKIFGAENSDELIDLNIKDLTLNFIDKDGRIDGLYEIGSGSNHMAYHLSTLLALHEFFLKRANHPVPNFIIFDQPSQAYFPERTDNESSDKNEDIIRVKKIFQCLSSAITRTKGNLQIIILEHVGEYGWAGLPNMKKVKRWRDDEDDNALIPRDWLN